MKRTRFFPFLLAAAAAVSLAGISHPALAQQGAMKIGIVDMQDSLNRYYKTALEVEKINELAREKRKNLDERQADLQALTNQLTELDKKARDTSLSEAIRQDAVAQLQRILQERTTKDREIREAQRKYQAEILKARQEMEATLVAEIRDILNGIAEKQGYDLVLDKSFLPKANKVIVFDSPKVPNLTEEVIAALNANAPAGSIPAPPEGGGKGAGKGAAPAPGTPGAPETGVSPN